MLTFQTLKTWMIMIASRDSIWRRTAPSHAVCAAFLLITWPTVGQAQSMTDVKEEFRKWGVFVPDNTASKTCFAATVPEDTEASRANIRRGAAFLMVANYPSEGVSNQVSVKLGYPADTNKPIQMKIGSRTFTMFANGEDAWLATPGEDTAVVQAMRRGATASVTATSSRGTTVTDKYSLLGFTAASNRAAEICK